MIFPTLYKCVTLRVVKQVIKICKKAQQTQQQQYRDVKQKDERIGKKEARGY